MPQEFQVLHCYSCDTYQDHQVKKSTKWNCKLCGEKQSIKKVYGRGSGYDCRQHVQKLNLMRGSLHNKEPVEQNAWVPNAECHSGDIEDCAEGEEHVILGNTFHQAESRKWSKYVDEEDGSSQTADYENHVDEMYTTDRNKFDGFLKQLKKSHKRKRLNSSNEGDDENSPPTSTQQETNRNPHKRTWTIANRSQQGTRKHNEQKLPSNKLRQEANKIMKISCDDRAESNDDAGIDNYSINVIVNFLIVNMYSRGNTGLSTYTQPENKPSKNQRVKVWARVRPTAHFDTEHLELLPDGRSINVHQKKESPKGVVNNQILDWSFRLDGVFHNASQDHVFETVASDIVTSTLDGYNGTIMCYGQTGAGKTFTITGATESYKQRGILPRAISQLFREIEERPEFSITVRVSYLEIYNESMVDLLATLPEAISQDNGQSMTVAENQYGVYVKGLSCHLTQNEEEALNYLFEGETNRAIAAHSLNAQSSRSHCIFTIYVETRSRVQSNARYTVSKLNFVDLAGSERLGKTKSDGKTQQEAMYINKSLTFLEQVIVALADRRREHIPFRQSKLTHCLKDSIGGNCNTLLIANIWGEKQQLEESVSTLRFATRMMCVASEPAMNEIIDPVIQVKRLEKEIQHLKHELAMHDTLTNRSHITYDPLSEQQRYEIRQQVRRFLEGHLDEVDIINVRQVQGVFESFKEIYAQMEKDVEERLRQKFTLIDRTDPAAIAAAQQAGLAVTDEGLLVGDTDGLGFGVGVAPKSAKADPSAVVQLKRKEKEKKGKISRQDTKSPTGGKSVSSPSHSAKGEREVKSPHPSVDRTRDEDAATPASSVGGPKTDRPTRASTPPSRTTAFDIFKSEKGSELNRILIENKDILAANKKSYSDLARGINSTKVEIDQCRMHLDKLKEERESNGTQYNEEGDIIISEEEFLGVKKLKELKSKYKTDFEELKNLKAKVQYCQRLVDNCRQKLIQEFDKWYSESFLQTEDLTTTSMGAGHGIRPGVLPPFNPNTVSEDEQEKFDRLQMELLMNNPDSAAYYNAQHRTQRRKTYEAAMMQPQPSFRRSPGTPTMSIRNRPPTMLQVSQ